MSREHCRPRIVSGCAGKSTGTLMPRRISLSTLKRFTISDGGTQRWTISARLSLNVTPIPLDAVSVFLGNITHQSSC